MSSLVVLRSVPDCFLKTLLHQMPNYLCAKVEGSTFILQSFMQTAKKEKEKEKCAEWTAVAFVMQHTWRNRVSLPASMSARILMLPVATVTLPTSAFTLRRALGLCVAELSSLLFIKRKKVIKGEGEKKKVVKNAPDNPSENTLWFLGHCETNKVSTFARFSSYQRLWSGTSHNWLITH